MRWRMLGLWLALMWSAATLSQAAFPVIDTASLSQMIIQIEHQVREYAAILRDLEYQYTQIQNQMAQIQHAATTVQHGVQNLAQLDLNNASDLFGLVRQLESKLGQARYIGYQAQQAVGQAEQYYPLLEAVADADARRALELQWASMRQNSAKVAIATQAIEQSQHLVGAKWQDVLNQARAAQGNLQAQQAAVQAQGLVGNQLMSIEQLMATQARMMSENAMAQASRVVMEERAIAHATQEFRTTYRSQGQLLPMMRTGRE